MHGFRQSVHNLGLTAAVLGWRSKPQPGDLFTLPACMVLEGDGAHMARGSKLLLRYHPDEEAITVHVPHVCDSETCERRLSRRTVAVITTAEEWEVFKAFAQSRGVTWTRVDLYHLRSETILPEEPTRAALRMRRNARRIFIGAIAGVSGYYVIWRLMGGEKATDASAEESQQAAVAR